jgi:glycine betaine catabolism B
VHELEFYKKEFIAKDIYSFYFKPESPIKFVAGQFIELYLPHKQPDERGIKRWFTVSSAPEEPLISITTKIIKNNSSFKKTLDCLSAGDKVKMASPMGDFVLPKDVAAPLLFVAGGIGCTPFHSMVQHLKNIGEARDIKFIYSADHEEEVAFKELFEEQTSLEIIISKSNKTWQGQRGKITPDFIKELASDRKIYISGPEPMVESLINGLIKIGVKKQKIHGDYFPGYETI